MGQQKDVLFVEERRGHMEAVGREKLLQVCLQSCQRTNRKLRRVYLVCMFLWLVGGLETLVERVTKYLFSL